MQLFMKKIWNVIDTIVYKMLKVIFTLLKRELTNDMYLTFMQFVKFGIVGVSNTILSYVLYLLSLVAFQRLGVLPKSDYLVAQVISFVLSVAWSFYWNNKMVFVKEKGQERDIWKALIKTYISYSFTGLFLNSFLLVLWVQMLNISEFIAPIINLLISVPVNFVINKFWAFK